MAMRRVYCPRQRIAMTVSLTPSLSHWERGILRFAT
jgi:hypothetical protein